MARHDNSYKLFFAHKEMVEDLLRDFVPADLVAQVDFSTLEKVNGSFVSDDLKDREDDVIWRVKAKDRWLYVYILLEFQSRVDRFMALRMMVYVGLLYQDLLRGKHLSDNGLLPPVLPIVLYNGEKRWTAATEISALIDSLPGELADFRPQMRYLLLDEQRYNDSELAPLKNVVAALFRLENSRHLGDVQRVIAALLVWLQAPEQVSLKRTFATWLKQIILPARMPGAELPELQHLEEVQDMLANRVKEWTQQWEENGLRKGLEQGIAAERKMLLRLILRRFGEDIAFQASAMLERCDDFAGLEQIAERIIDCQDGNAFLAHLRDLATE